MRPPARTVALFACGYLALVALAGFPLLRAPWPAVPMAPQVPGWLPGDGDPLYHLWWIDWLWSHPRTLFESGARTDAFFAPFGAQLGLVQAQLFQGLLVLALRPLGDPALAYSVLWALSFLLTALATAALAWEVTRSLPGAFLAGLLTAFGSAFFVHSLEHVFKYLGFFWLPLALLSLRRVFEGGGRRALAFVFACSALILLSDWYNALYVVVGATVLWGHRFIAAPLDRSVLFRHTAALAVLLPPLAAILWWTLAPVLAVEAETLRASVAEQAQYSVDLQNLFLPHPYHPLWGRFSAARHAALPGNVFEKTAFFGWLLPAIVGALVFRARRQTALHPWLLLLAVFLLLALGPALQWGGRPLLPLPGAWLGQLPGFAGSRAPGRYVVAATLAFAVLAAAVVARQRRPVLAALGLGVLGLLEIGPFAAPMAALEPSPVLRRLGRMPGAGAVLDVPFHYAVRRYAYDQTLHRRPTVGGTMIRYTPRFITHPVDVPGFDLLRNPVGAAPPDQPERLAFALARLLGVEYLVVHKRYAGDGAVRRLLASGLPLEEVEADAHVVLLRLDPQRVAEIDAASVEAGSPDAAGRRLTLGWSAGGARADGVAYLWSEGTEAALALAPPSWARVASLEVLSYEAAATGRRPHAVVSADGRAQSIELAPTWVEVRLPVPARPREPWVVRFRTTGCVRPVDVEPGNADLRCLALGLGRITWSR